MCQVEDETAAISGDEKATEFNAETCLNVFNTCAEYYNLRLGEWCKCLIADNSAKNLKLAHLASIPHVGCNSQKLHHEVNHMAANHQNMHSTPDEVHDVMRDAKMNIKNEAILRYITDIKPKLDRDIWWSGKYEILQRFEAMRDKFIEACAHPDIDMVIDESV